MTPNDSSHTWPELPNADELVRLSLPLHPQLIDAAGYHGAARHVARFSTPYGDEVMLSDGAVTRTGWCPAWTTLAHHPIGRTIFGPYTLGGSDAVAVHWLLADRHARMLDVGAELDVRQFLATQPSELSAGGRGPRRRSTPGPPAREIASATVGRTGPHTPGPFPGAGRGVEDVARSSARGHA
jgi:hypothetical protein